MIRKEDMDNPTIRDTKILVMTGTGLFANPSRDATMHAIKLVRQNGGINVFNLDWRPTLWAGVDASERLEYYRKAAEVSDILVGKDKEYMAATGTSSVDEVIPSISPIKKKFLLLTRGEDGCRMYRGNEIIDSKPFKVDVLKTLGAGDGILSGVLFGYLRGWDPDKMLRFGNAVAAIVVTRHSCSEAMPSYEETVRFIETHGGW